MGGPPNPMQPIRPHSRTMVPSVTAGPEGTARFCHRRRGRLASTSAAGEADALVSATDASHEAPGRPHRHGVIAEHRRRPGCSGGRGGETCAFPRGLVADGGDADRAPVRTLPIPLYGVTVDSVANLSAIVAGSETLGHMPITRVYFNVKEPASYYAAAVRALQPVSYVMGELLDSSDSRHIATASYDKHVQSYVATARLLGRRVGDRQRGERQLDGAVLQGRSQAHRRLRRRDCRREGAPPSRSTTTSAAATDRRSSTRSHSRSGTSRPRCDRGSTTSFFPTTRGTARAFDRPPPPGRRTSPGSTPSIPHALLGFGEIGMDSARHDRHPRHGRVDHAVLTTGSTSTFRTTSAATSGGTTTRTACPRHQATLGHPAERIRVGDGRAGPLKPATSLWSVTDALAQPQRKLTLSGCVNFRDLGGYPAADGRNIRWRRLFRADGLTRLDEEDCAQLAGLGLATVIDLRTKGEVDERGRFPEDAFEVEYHHLPLTDVLPPTEDLSRYDEPAFVTSRYHQLFSEGSSSLARAVRRAGRARGPARRCSTAAPGRTAPASSPRSCSASWACPATSSSRTTR